jgi:DNA topoisomerase III
MRLCDFGSSFFIPTTLVQIFFLYICLPGLNNACSVHEWNGQFKNESVKFKMTSVCGHVMSLDFTSKYNSWDKVDPVELFSCPTEKKEATAKLRMPAFLSQESKGCSILVLWLDCDKEGENICFEVMDAVQGNIKNVSSPQVGREFLKFVKRC